MIVKFHTDDIVKFIRDNKPNGVVHGCNCFHVMGGGVARVLDKSLEGKLLEADIAYGKRGDINKLGESSFYFDEANYVWYCNLYSQHGFMGSDGGVYVHWQSVSDGLEYIIDFLSCQFQGDIDLAIVPIGTGLAGGDMSDFLAIIDDIVHVFDDSVTLHVVAFDVDWSQFGR